MIPPWTSTPSELVAELEARTPPARGRTVGSVVAVEHRVVTRGRGTAHHRRAGAPRVPGRPVRFAALRAARAELASSPDADPLLRRQVDLLHDAFVTQQVPADLRRAIVELETRVESTFNNFRGKIDGRRVDDNAIAEILRTSDDEAERRAAWEASKQIGPEVADRIRELVRLRNEAARGARCPRPLRARARVRRARRGSPLRHARRRRPRHRGSVRRVEARRRCVARPPVRLPRRRAAPLALRRSLLPDATRRGRGRHRPPLHRRRPRGAHRTDLRRPRARRAHRARAQRPLCARREEPARVLHRHRSRRRRARALQRRAQRAVDGHHAPRVRPRDLRPRVGSRRSRGSCAAPPTP